MRYLLRVAFMLLAVAVGHASITSQTDRSSLVLITGLPQTVPTGFPFQQGANLVVLDIGSVATPRSPYTTLTLGSDYTVTGGGYNSATQMLVGSIQVVSTGANAVLTNDQLIILRGVPINQITSFSSTGPLTISLIEQALDKQATLSQQINQATVNSLHFEPWESASTLLTKASRAGKYQAYDSNGLPVFLSGTGSVPADASLSLVTATGSTTGRGLAVRFGEMMTVKDFGATGDGVTDDTAAFTGALAASSSVVVPAGTYVVTGFSIPINTTLLLRPGAQIKTSGAIQMQAVNSHLIGPVAGNSLVVTTSATASIVWTGAVSNSVLLLGTTGVMRGNSVQGITIHGGGIASITGMKLGAAGFGAGWCQFRDITINEVFTGVNVADGIQVCQFSNIIVRNQSGGTAYNAAGSIAFAVGTSAAPDAIAGIDFDGCVSDGLESGFVCGTSTGTVGCSGLTIRGRTVLEAGKVDGGAAIAFLGGGPYRVMNAFIEGPGAGTTTTRAIIIGTVTGNPTGVVIRDNYIQGFNGGTMIEAFSFSGLVVEGNLIDYTPASTICFKNTGGGTERFGVWRDNITFPNTTNFSDFYNEVVTGFVVAQRNNTYFNGANTPWPITKPPATVSASIADSAIIKLVASAFVGIVTIFNGDNQMGQFSIRGASNATALLLDPSSSYSITKDTANRMNIYWSGSQYELQNKLGSPKTFTLSFQEFKP